MAITDIQISEELETSAPSIKYRGDEGPKSPQEEQMMMADAILKEEYNKYVFDLLEIRPEATPMTIEEFRQMVIAEGQMSGGQPLPQDPTKPVNPFQPKPTGPVLPDRQMAAYGGIMGLDRRRKYGLGSSLKKTIRKIIPNEVAAVAEKAAPFIALAAPQFALPAALAGGLGRFDRTGSIGSGLKSGLMTYGLGTLSPGLPGVRDMGPKSGMFTTQPFDGQYNISNLFKNKQVSPDKIGYGEGKVDPKLAQAVKDQPTFVEKITNKISDFIPESTLGKVALGGGAIALGTQLLGQGPEETVSEIMDRGEGLDLDSIRLEVREAFKDETGQKLLALRNKYPYLGTQASKDVANMAMGGRIGYQDAGPVLDKQTTKMILDMYGRGMDIDTIQTITQQDPNAINAVIKLKNISRQMPREKLPQDNRIDDPLNRAYGGRIGKAEGGIMDLGGMEKDYRNTGGFVDLGAKEKADDVPARLSVNEFVFTADAVRNAGGGDIDKGAEVMENMMKNLEAGGQVSEESQGIQSLRAGGRAGFANGLTVDTDKVIEDIKKFSIPGLIGRGVKTGADKISDIDLETIIKVVSKITPSGMVMEKVTDFLVDRYGMSVDEAQMRIVNKLGTDANEGFKQPSGTSDEGYRMVGIESSAEDTSDIPIRNRLKNILSRAPSIEMPRPKRRFPDMDPGFTIPKPPLSPDATNLNPHQDINPLQTMEFRDRNGNGIEDRAEGIYDYDRDLIPFNPNRNKRFLPRPSRKNRLEEMFNTSERLSEVTG